MTPEEFEQQVERIYKLLERSGEVTWNDHVPDPADGGTRQIDITVRRGESLTLIECRHRNKPQDKRWIEELFGRRFGIKADAVVAVSSSGFSRGAIEKAKQLGVVLRSFSEVTEDDVVLWPSLVTIDLVFVEFKSLTLNVTVPARFRSANNLLTSDGAQFNVADVCHILADQVIDRLENDGPWIGIRARVQGKFGWGSYGIPELIAGSHVRKRIVKEVVHTRMKMVDPRSPAVDIALVEKSGAVSEWIKKEGAAGWSIDLSSVEAPPNSVFKYILSEHSSGVVLTNASIKMGGCLAKFPPAKIVANFV